VFPRGILVARLVVLLVLYSIVYGLLTSPGSQLSSTVMSFPIFLPEANADNLSRTGFSMPFAETTPNDEEGGLLDVGIAMNPFASRTLATRRPGSQEYTTCITI